MGPTEEEIDDRPLKERLKEKIRERFSDPYFIALNFLFLWFALILALWKMDMDINAVTQFVNDQISKPTFMFPGVEK